MIPPAFWLLAISPTPQVLLEESVRLPAGEPVQLSLAARRGPGRLDCVMQVVDGDGRVHAVLQGAGGQVLASTAFNRIGRLSAELRAPVIPVLALANSESARLRVRVLWLPVAVELSPLKRWTVVLLTLIVFAGILYFAGRPLWRATAYRRRYGFPPEDY